MSHILTVFIVIYVDLVFPHNFIVSGIKWLKICLDFILNVIQFCWYTFVFVDYQLVRRAS